MAYALQAVLPHMTGAKEEAGLELYTTTKSACKGGLGGGQVKQTLLFRHCHIILSCYRITLGT